VVQIGSFDIELVPSTSWGKSLSKLSRTSGVGFGRRWLKIRERELARAGNQCEICGFVGKGLNCHEKWQYDETNLIQKLIGYEIVCPNCNLILHFGRTLAIGMESIAIAHFSKVTGLKKGDLERAGYQAMVEWMERSKKKWYIDISSELWALGFEDAINR